MQQYFSDGITGDIISRWINTTASSQSGLALVHLYRQSHELAELYYQKALGLNRNRPTLVATGGLFYYYLGKTEEAIRCFAEAKVLDPSRTGCTFIGSICWRACVRRGYRNSIGRMSR